MKSAITICVVSLLLTACRHVEPVTRQLEPERQSTDEEIRQHIVGEWTSSESDGFGYPKMIVGDDRRLVGVSTNGTRVLIGTWEYQGHALRVTPTAARIEAARASGFQMNAWDYYPVIYADAHELVMAPGISVAGRWRFTR